LSAIKPEILLQPQRNKFALGIKLDLATRQEQGLREMCLLATKPDIAIQAKITSILVDMPQEMQLLVAETLQSVGMLELLGRFSPSQH